MCAEPIAEEHQHVVNLESRALMCTCRGCYLLFTDEQATLRYRAVPDRYLSFPDFSFGAGDGTSCRSRSGSPSCSTTPCRTGSSRSTRARPGATESELPLDAWERIVAANPRARPRCAPTSRRCSCAARTASSPASAATWCRSTPATSWSAGCARCGAASTAARRRAPRSTSSSPWSRSAAVRRLRRRRRRRHEHLRVLGRRHLRRAVRRAPQLTARLRIEESQRPDDPRDRAALPGPDRAAAPPLRRGRRERPARPVRRPGPLGRHAQAVPVDAVQRDGPGVHRHHRGRPRRCRAPTTST